MLFKAALDQRPYPVFVMTADWVVRAANAAAKSGVCSRALQIEENAVLRIEDGLASRAFAKALKRVRSSTSRTDGLELIPCEHPGGSPLLLSATLLNAFAGPCEQHGIWFIVSVRSNLGSLSVSLERLMTTFGFTRAEANLCSAIVQGLSLADYAEREGVKITTVRWHLQNVFARVNVRSQAELVAMVVSVLG